MHYIERNSEGGSASNSQPTWKRVSRHGLFQFIAVGTPPDEDGSADLQARAIGREDDR